MDREKKLNWPDLTQPHQSSSAPHNWHTDPESKIGHILTKLALLWLFDLDNCDTVPESKIDQVLKKKMALLGGYLI